MKTTTIVLILSTLFLLSCSGVQDTSPEPKTPEPITVQPEAENTATLVSWNEDSQQTPEESLKIDTETKPEGSLENF